MRILGRGAIASRGGAVIVVVKIGTSSVTDDAGAVDDVAVRKLCDEVALARAAGHDVVIVTSGAVTAGVAVLRPPGGRPTDAITLQALSSIGQPRLMRVYDDALRAHGIARRAGACWHRSTSVNVASTCTPDGRSFACSSSAWCRS